MGSLLGAFGSGGVCLSIAIWVILGSRKKEKQGKLAQKHQDHHTAWWAITFGVFAAGAGQAFTAPGQVGHAITRAFTSQALGNVGAGATAMVLTLFLFGTRPGVIKDSVLGSVVPSVYAAAGGMWALPITVIGSVLHGLVGS